MANTSGKAILDAFITTALVVFLFVASFANMGPMVLGDGPAILSNSSDGEITNSSGGGISNSSAPVDAPWTDLPPALADAGANLSFVRYCVAGESGRETPANVSVTTDRAIYCLLDNVTLFVRSPAGTASAYAVDPSGNTSRLNLTEYGGGYFSVFYPVSPGNYSMVAEAMGPDLNVTKANTSFIVQDNLTDTVENAHNASLNATGDKAPGKEEKGTGARYTIYDPAKKVVILKNDSGDTLVPTDGEDEDKIYEEYGIDRNHTKATMTSTLSPDGKHLHISLDNKTDGCWYKLSAPIPAGYQVLGVYRDNGSEIPGKRGLRQNRNTSQVLSEWYVENNTIYFYDDPSSGYDILLGPSMGLLGSDPAPTLNKTLYLWPQPSLLLNTSVSPYSNGNTTYSLPLLGYVTKTWVLSPAFTKDFTLKDPITAYIYVESGGISLLGGESVYLYDEDASGNRNLIAEDTNIQQSGGTIKLQTVTFESVTSYTVQAGHHIEMDLRAGGLLSLATVKIHQSPTYPSRIEMDTDTYISVDDIRIRDTSNNVITSTTTPSTIKAWANVSDPFGSYDINSVNATLYYPNGTQFLGPTTMSRTGSGTAWATYSANFSLPGEIDGGYYNMYVWATETNGVQSYNNTTLYVYGPPKVEVNKTITHASGNNYTVTIKLKNNRSWEAKNVYAYDFYPTGANGFTASDFNPSGSYPEISAWNLTIWDVAGNVITLGPFDIPAQGMTTITYTLAGSGNYSISDLYIVGVDPP